MNWFECCLGELGWMGFIHLSTLSNVACLPCQMTCKLYRILNKSLEFLSHASFKKNPKFLTHVSLILLRGVQALTFLLCNFNLATCNLLLILTKKVLAHYFCYICLFNFFLVIKDSSYAFRNVYLPTWPPQCFTLLVMIIYFIFNTIVPKVRNQIFIFIKQSYMFLLRIWNSKSLTYLLTYLCVLFHARLIV